jgi:MFS family permease
MVSAVFWTMLVLTVPIGTLIDRWSRKKSIGVMSTLWGLATAAGALTTNFGQLFATRAAVGVGEAGYSAGGTALISAFFPAERRARMIGIWYSAIPLGQAIGIALGGVIAVALGWRSALGIMALPGIAVALLFFTIKDYKTVELVRSVPKGGGVSKAKMSKLDIVRELFRSKALVLSNLAFAGSAFMIVGLTTWLPAYFQRYEGMSIERSGMMTGVIMLLAIVGGPVSGILTDRWHAKRPNARMLIPAITCSITAILLFIAFRFHGGVQFGLLLGVGLFAIMFTPGAISVTQDVVHPGLRSTSLSINVVTQHLLGSSTGPLVIGALADRFGLDKALLCLPAALLFSATLFFIGSFFYTADLQKVEKVEVVLENG